ncbi:MAG TPA: aminotransferase class V-fold PLP-dependent enzyme [Planctomycetes bacterium]|nr:aminotransferase class V-fold PLP-dependent enzyme [Planctomycetaceae bacterium]HIM30667.1 aminotransferase class V-fold PLP-dependent enzyme [Planctomycetota bacterium]
MVNKPVYMDNHATTRVDPRVLTAMLPWFTEHYGNAGSVAHPFGWDALEAVDNARKSVAQSIGARDREIVFTSGATESNNLAIRGVSQAPRRRGNHLISLKTEHKAVLDPLKRLARQGFEITVLDVAEADREDTGMVDLDRLRDTIGDETILVSVMLANNEIGTLQPIREIADICHSKGVPLHCDATQAIGKISVDVTQLDIDYLSFSAHKIYGPKGIGGFYIRRRPTGARLLPQLDGGGQEHGLRSGTLNVPGIVGLAEAMRLCDEVRLEEEPRVHAIRDRLAKSLQSAVRDTLLNGPPLGADNHLSNNLNLTFCGVDGEALMMSMRDLAVSSGSACTSANPEPSHVLRAIGRSDEDTRASLRFGIGRFNTEEEVDFAVSLISDTVSRLRKMGNPS